MTGYGRMKKTRIPACVLKSIRIEEALQKMGWKTEVIFSNSEGSQSFYINIGIWLNSGEDNEEWFERKIRFSDHELPSYYGEPDYECRFDLDGAAWSKLKPKLKKLFMTTQFGIKD